jgi:hypothetical protein
MSPRVLSASENAVKLVEIYFDVVISYAQEAQVRELVPVIFSRITHVR